ncbi:MAG TPA: hypothetical protein VNO70_00180 [Blastocatellia bacterium]|nr:hypothetical protein [Blastocatellia bacterium]
MSTLTRAIVAKLFGVIGATLLLQGLTCGQSLNSKLLQEASFVPKSTLAVDQLIEVAQHYQIPMGIEWIEQPGTNAPLLPQKKPKTVRDLLAAILQQSPGYRMKAIDGVLHIYNQKFVTDQRNFLNLRIPEFRLDRANVFDANARLRLQIKMTLHPELYARGWNGGYTSPPGHTLDVENITFSGRNLTVREILSKISAANGNTLWVVFLDPSKRMAGERFYASGSVSGEATDFHWRFIPLKKD